MCGYILCLYAIILNNSENDFADMKTMVYDTAQDREVHLVGTFLVPQIYKNYNCY